MKRPFFVLPLLLSCAGLAAGTATGLAADTAANQPATPAYEFKLQKAEDSGAVKTDEKRTLLVVTSASGIGSATVALPSGKWPKRITLRFEYLKGRGFDVLEGFNMTTARFQIQGAARPGQSRMPFHLLDGDGKADAGEAPAGELNVVVERRQGALEISLPPNLFTGSKEVRVGWIDFYR